MRGGGSVVALVCGIKSHATAYLYRTSAWRGGNGRQWVEVGAIWRLAHAACNYDTAAIRHPMSHSATSSAKIVQVFPAIGIISSVLLGIFFRVFSASYDEIQQIYYILFYSSNFKDLKITEIIKKAYITLNISLVSIRFVFPSTHLKFYSLFFISRNTMFISQDISIKFSVYFLFYEFYMLSKFHLKHDI